MTRPQIVVPSRSGTATNYGSNKSFKPYQIAGHPKRAATISLNGSVDSLLAPNSKVFRVECEAYVLPLTEIEWHVKDT